MSRTTNESEDGVLSKDQIDSPLMDESNGGSGNGGMVLKKGPWTSAEDAILVEYVKKHGEGNWNAVQKHSGLFRCGKSCRLRWANHLRPNLKKGAFTPEEERLIVELHAKMGNKWARMAAHVVISIRYVCSSSDFSQLEGIGDLAKKMVETRMHQVFNYVYLLITLSLVLPVATASVERAFSVMNIVKGPLRNKMGDQWLSDSLLVYIERDIVACIENEAIMLRFQNMKSRRGQL